MGTVGSVIGLQGLADVRALFGFELFGASQGPIEANIVFSLEREKVAWSI